MVSKKNMAFFILNLQNSLQRLILQVKDIIKDFHWKQLINLSQSN